jgi:hypothetical protein
VTGTTAFRPEYDRGSPDKWAAVPLVAHHSQFKARQAERIRAIAPGQVPRRYGAAYQWYSTQPPACLSVLPSGGRAAQ